MFQDEINKLNYSKNNLIKIPKKIVKNLDKIYKETNKSEIKLITNTSNVLNDTEKNTL